MFNECSLTALQKSFECSKCGFCCLHGGQILVTTQELNTIAEYYGVDPSDKVHMPFIIDKERPGYMKLAVIAPCFFLDKERLTCMIHEIKPQFCRDYPFKLLEKGQCGWFDALMCPQARKDLDKHFSIKRVDP